VSLADFKGKTVVLEWVNPECPYVRKHYDSANMQGTQKAATAKGVVWLSVNSSHASHGDHKKPAEMAAWNQRQGACTDGHADGRGRPHRARLRRAHDAPPVRGRRAGYAGLCRRHRRPPQRKSRPTSRSRRTSSMRHWPTVLAGRPVAQPVTRPYGCSVKYADG
jgi:hypothetical protein